MDRFNVSEAGAIDGFHFDFKGESLVCEKILRQLPGRRIACRAQWGERIVFAKLFFGKKFDYYGEQEKRGVAALEQAGVRTSSLIDTYCDSEKKVMVLLFEWLEEAGTLEQRLSEAKSEKERFTLLETVVEIIGRMHKRGVEQVDIHLDNFLVVNGAVYTIDGALVDDSAKKSDSPLSFDKSVHNLALFFAQFPPADDSRIKHLLGHYRQACGLSEQELSLHRMEEKILELRKWREKKYVRKKSLRNCSDFVCKKSWKRFSVFDRETLTPDLETFCLNPDQFFSRGRVLKNGRSSGVRVVELGGKNYVIKKYYLKNYLHFIFRSILPSRAEVSWRNGVLLRYLHIATPRPIVLVENRFGPLRGTSFIVTELIEGEHAWAYFVEGGHSEEDSQDVANKLVNILKNLERVMISHGDLKATNVLISQGEPLLIDLDAMISWKNEEGFRKRFRKDIEHFLNSWSKNERAVTFFMKCFSEAGLVQPKND